MANECPGGRFANKLSRIYRKREKREYLTSRNFPAIRYIEAS